MKTELAKFSQGIDMLKTKIHDRISSTASFYSDKARLNVIISKLLNNAIKNRPAPPVQHEIWLEMASDNNSLELKVTHNGNGVPPHNLDKIFDLSIEDRETQGIDIDLFVTRKTVESLNGKIIAESFGVQGCTFSVLLPNLKPT